MAIVNLQEVLALAEKGKYAVGSFNVVNYESVKGILAGAEEINSPVILAIAQVQLEEVDFSSIMNILAHEAKRATVPVAIHFDHGMDFSTIRQAIKLGCSSVMFDGSQLPLDENIRQTKEVVAYAHARNVSVEGEVGMMGREGGGTQSTAELQLTDPASAERFVKETGVDALAIAFGTVHGMMKTEPRLDLELLSCIYDRVSIPLVVHGGSGLVDEDYRNMIARGIRKINYFTDGYRDVATCLGKYMVEHPHTLYDELSFYTTNAFKKVFREIMETFGSAEAV